MIVLHTEMIDKMVRDFVINYEIRVTNRGEGIVYRRWFPQFGKEVYKKRIGKIRLPLPDHYLCNYKTCLGCKNLHAKKIHKRCMTIRAIYERRKEDFLNTQSQKNEEENSTKSKYITKEEALKWAIDNMFSCPKTQYKIIEWLKDGGLVLKHTEFRDVSNQLLEMKRETDTISG